MDNVRETGAMSPRERWYNEGYKDGYKDGYEKGKADAFCWTLREEKLPDVGEDGISDLVLLSFENHPMPCIGRYYQEKDGSGWFGLLEDKEPISIIGLFVNAWMPLMEPYRG